ncbi:MAG: hypothetical protein NTV86_07255 [Planctomycetota bacterium]|nr:hypothetical protein [Planctomycetota bacterium]
MRHYALYLLLAPAFLAGCADQDEPISWPRQNMTAAERNFEANWIGAQQALRSYGFKIARMDRRARLIVTEPMIGQHATEFWRKDAVSVSDVAESTVQTIYRTAQVEFRPLAHFPDDFEPVAVVRVARSDKPNRYVRTTNDAYTMFREPIEKWASAHPVPPKADAIDKLPNDNRLANDIALSIRVRAHQILQDNPPRISPR